MGKFIKEATPPPSRRQGCPLENKKERNKNLKDLHILRLTKIATATLYII